MPLHKRWSRNLSTTHVTLSMQAGELLSLLGNGEGVTPYTVN